MVEATQTSDITLYPHEFVVAELGGKIFWGADAKTVAAWRLHLSQRVRGHHHAIYRHA